ncbi:MAG: transcriptional regulator with HTH domain and aminotransferase domain [Erysipelotrichaceae bacterium]|nr:MAG: transcriptional regulator with HTH domain and aminotransferase [Erysipelotrichaceae bacterium]TXT18694.1 MAG: transcriptional regulator with HTH domain and aminotransferase domain [Erysipelotrichaceae bacterium]
MQLRFARRVANAKKSFIREIFKVLGQKDMISFSGGFPNPSSFPIEGIKAAAIKVLDSDGANALQYSSTEGYLPLREYIAKRYFARFELKVDPSEILIVNGSQQAFDLISKVFLDIGDTVVVEKPAYLGALQSFGFYEPTYKVVPLTETGLDLVALKDALKDNPKLMYVVPNFQNPTGLTYSNENRIAIADLLRKTDTILIEDDPYGELRFKGIDHQPIKSVLDEQTILLGSFSKIVSPGMRMGWIVAKKEIMEKLVIAKQASDLHSNYFTQRIITQYLMDNDIDKHIETIKAMYLKQREQMLTSMKQYFDPSITYTQPEGGMFLWVTLPEGVSAMKLFESAVVQKIVYVPGDPFYTVGEDLNTLRMNYTNSTPKEIDEGVQRLAKVFNEAIKKTNSR